MRSKRKNSSKSSPSKRALADVGDNIEAENSSDGDNSSPHRRRLPFRWGKSSSEPSNSSPNSIRCKMPAKDETTIHMPTRPSTPSRTKMAPSRFSLRRLFYGNSLLAQPFLRTPLATPAPSSSIRRGGHKGTTPVPAPRSVYDDQSDTRSVWHDNVSSCSSVHGMATASIFTNDPNVIMTCPLCLAEWPPDQFPILSNCMHMSCINCLQTYVRIEIQEGRANIKCPKCPEQMHPNDIETLIGEKNSNLLTLYESLMLRRVLAVDPDTRWCPGPNCTFAVIAAGCASCPKIDCERPGCGYSFCYHCKEQWHPNQTCDSARAQRQPFRSSSNATISFDASVMSGDNIGGHSGSEVKVCPRCNVLIVKMDDGSCNHMTCSVCGVEFCWLCMKEISDLHYLSPSGCTFWGKKPWSRKKKLLWQLGTLVGAPVGIAMLAVLTIPATMIGLPSYVGQKLKDHYKNDNKHKRNTAVIGGVVFSFVMSPLIAGFAVVLGVPILLCYVYGVVPIALCRSEGCGMTTSSSGVKIDIDEDPPYRPALSAEASSIIAGNVVTNPSIGEASLGASLSMGSGCLLENAEEMREPGDRDDASNTAVAGSPMTASATRSHIFKGSRYSKNRLEVGADVHPRKKYSCSSETVSLSERSVTASCATDDGGSAAASTRALAGSLLAYRWFGDSQSVHSYRITGGEKGGSVCDEVSLRSLPLSSGLQISTNSGTHAHASAHLAAPSANPRSMSPVSSMSGDEVILRRSQRRTQRPLLDKQLSENSSLLSAEDTVSERVRFDDNVSFIDDCVVINAAVEKGDSDGVADSSTHNNRLKAGKVDSNILPEETAEELAEVISPQLKHRHVEDVVIDESGSSIVVQGGDVTLLSIGNDGDD